MRRAQNINTMKGNNQSNRDFVSKLISVVLYEFNIDSFFPGNKICSFTCSFNIPTQIVHFCQILHESMAALTCV